tara:strand:- start:2205 stop:5903 length:3699 start_codon:yes stop_codon:yes gene_type:complete
MDTTRRYREINRRYGHGDLNLPKLTKNFKEFKYYQPRGDEGRLDWVRKGNSAILTGAHRYGDMEDMYSTTHLDEIKTDENGRPYVVIRYDPRRTGSRLPIEKKGDKWFLEDNLGFAKRDTLDTPLGKRDRDVVINDGKGLEIRKVMGKKPKDFRTTEKKVKLKDGTTKMLPPEDVGEWKRKLGGDKFAKAGRPSAHDNINITNRPVVAQLEFYLPKVEVATESGKEAIDDYFDKARTLRVYDKLMRATRRFKKPITERIKLNERELARREEQNEEVKKANKFLSETTDKPIGGKFMAKAEKSFMEREPTWEENRKGARDDFKFMWGIGGLGIYDERVLTPREAKEYILGRSTGSRGRGGGVMGQTGLYTEEELKDGVWDDKYTHYRRKKFRELTTKKQMVARRILMKDLFKPVSKLNASNRQRQRRKPLRANVRRDRNKEEAFSQNVRERDEQRKTAKVDTEEGVRYSQRSGAMTATDLMKTAPPTYHQRGIRDRRTAGGQILRGDREGRRRLLNDSRYISATEQAIIDRRIRNTEAERKLDEKIKDVRKEEKEKQDKLSVINQTKQKVIEDLQRQNNGQLLSHQMITRGNLSATILGSDAVELNKIIARGGGYMTILRDMVRKGEITDRAIIGQLDFSGHTSKEKRKRKVSLLNLLDEGSEFQPNKRYFFKEMDEMGKPQSYSGIFIKGGERGSNLLMLMEDGSKRLIRKRQIILPEEAVGKDPQPQLPPPTLGGGIAPSVIIGGGGSPVVQQGTGGGVGIGVDFSAVPEEQQGFLGGGFLAQTDASSSSTSTISSVSGDEIGGGGEGISIGGGLPDPLVARYNELIPKVEKDERLLKAFASDLDTIEERRPKAGFFGRVNVEEMKLWTAEKQKLQNRVPEMSRILEQEKAEANSIAAKYEYDIPFKDFRSIEGLEERRPSLDIPASELLKQQLLLQMGGQSPRAISTETEGLTPRIEAEIGFLQQGLETEEEELQPEPEPQVVSTSEFDASRQELLNILDAPPAGEIFDKAQEEREHLDNLYREMEVSEDNPAYVKFKWRGYDMLVDTENDTVFDPLGQLGYYQITPFTKPTSDKFIKFPSDSDRIVALDYIKQIEAQEKGEEEAKAKAQSLTEEREAFGFTRGEMKAKAKDLIRLAGDDKVFLWSTKFPTEWKVGGRRVEGQFLTKSQFESYIDEAEVKGKSKLNLLAKYDKALASKSKETAFNNQQVLHAMGLAPRPFDARTTMGQVD